jgi:hypothetical protein
MKTRTFLIAGALLLASATCHATVWRVNNNPALVQGPGSDPCDHCFTNLQDAENDPFVEPGDTLHLEPSPVSYGDIELDKRLVIIGPGYRLGQGTTNNAGLQANNGVAMIHGVTFNTNSDGSKLTGVVIGDGSLYGGIAIGSVNNITLDRNFHWARSISFNGSGINYFTITRCYFEGAGITTPLYDQVVSNVVIANNYFNGSISTDETFSNVTITNNLFNWNGMHSPWGAEVKNNIFVLGSMAVNNNVIHHNAAAGASSLPAGFNNLNGVVFTSVFNPAFTSDDQKWRLSSNYLTYMNLVGDDNTVPGMFGGNTPYQPSGVPAIPAVYQMTAPSTAIQGTPINVTIGTRSND